MFLVHCKLFFFFHNYPASVDLVRVMEALKEADNFLDKTLTEKCKVRNLIAEKCKMRNLIHVALTLIYTSRYNIRSLFC